MKTRTARRVRQWKKKYEEERRLRREIREAASDILQSHKFRRTREHVQHGNMTVREHCMNVTRKSLFLSERLHIPVRKREMIRGALLHDYFLYDWHKPDPLHPHRLHGFFHPQRALRNAEREYVLTDVERNIICNHMWPLTLRSIPTCREAWIVTMADKWCSLLETMKLQRGHGALIQKLRERSREEK